MTNPTHIFVANYCDYASYDAECDDHDADFENMASPHVALVSFELTEEFIAKCKQELIDEIQDLELCEGRDSETDALLGRTWVTDGWREVPENHGRSHQVWKFGGIKSGDVAGILVIQKMKVG